jgi:hypothetical protein
LEAIGSECGLMVQESIVLEAIGSECGLIVLESNVLEAIGSECGLIVPESIGYGSYRFRMWTYVSKFPCCSTYIRVKVLIKAVDSVVNPPKTPILFFVLLLL